MRQTTTKEYRDRRIVELWLERIEARRTGTDVVNFYDWLEAHRPELLEDGRPGERYQALKTLVTPFTRGDG